MSPPFAESRLPRGLLAEHLQRLQLNLQVLSGRLKEAIAAQVSDAVAALVRQSVQALLEGRPLASCSLPPRWPTPPSSALWPEDDSAEGQDGFPDEPWRPHWRQPGAEELELSPTGTPSRSVATGWLQLLPLLARGLCRWLGGSGSWPLACLQRLLRRFGSCRAGLLAATTAVVVTLCSLLSLSGVAQAVVTGLADAASD